MYRAEAPASGAAPARVRVKGAWRRAFDGASSSAQDPAFRRYLTDLVRPHGLPLDEKKISQGQSYAEMGAELLAGEVAADGPVDLLVFAFAGSDVAPWRNTSSYLSHLCPGQPFAFAVCDQGVIAPFTALRLIREYASTGGCRRAMLVVAEQAAMPYQPAVPAAMPARHAIVALLCDQSGPGRLDTGRLDTGRLDTVRLHTGVARSDAVRLLADSALGLSAGDDDLIMVAGAGLTAGTGCAGLPGQVVAAPPGLPSTGVWWEVAGRLPDWAGRRVLLADYDPLLGHLCTAAIEVCGERP